MVSQPLDINICWHCSKPNLTTEDFCTYCNGWALPTHETDGSEITWKTFVIVGRHSGETKHQLMEGAALAIEQKENVGILASKTENDNRGRKIEKKVLFRYKAGHTKVSFSIDKQKPHSRSWDVMTDSDIVWKSFKELVGERTIIYALPENFPRPQTQEGKDRQAEAVEKAKRKQPEEARWKQLVER